MSGNAPVSSSFLFFFFSSRRRHTRSLCDWSSDVCSSDLAEEKTHGTGCAFSSALAAQLASGRPLFEAAALAKTYVTKAIEKGYPIGKGRVPLDHFYRQRIEPPPRGIHEVPQHGLHPAAEPAAH